MKKGFLEVKKYNKLNNYIEAFRKKKMGLLIVVSRAGLGKTTAVEESLIADAPLILNSHITPLKFYQLLYERTQEEKDANPLIIIDEAEMMFQNQKLKTMLKILCDTKEEKTIRYVSSSPILDDYPDEFTTRAKAIILINTLKPRDEHIKAIMSRGHLLHFQPTNKEIIAYLETWAEDKEIIDFLKRFSSLSKDLNLRTYIKAKESKDSGLDWKIEAVNELQLDKRLLEIEKLLNDKKLKTDKDRIKKWASISKTNSRSTYYRMKKIYEERIS